MKNKNINVENSRTDVQREIMERIQRDGVCPFCRENFETYHTKPILFETEYWIVTENAWPYENTKQHFLFVAQEHVTAPSQLKDAAWSDLKESIVRLEREYDVVQGTLLMRFGDSKTTGATVDHLHAQLVVAESSEKPIRTRIG